MIKLNKSNLIGIGLGLLIIVVSAILLFMKVAFFDIKTFYFIAGIAVIIMVLPFFINLLIETKREKDKEAMFLEFARDLTEGVKAGTPINKTIINIRTKDYGSLNPHIEKLANQVSFGIPVKDALEIFSADIKSPVISRAVSLVREAELAGGKIEMILESVTASLAQIEKLKKERKAAIYNLTVQGYIIFFIFLIIMLIMQFKILPITTELQIGTGVSEEISEVAGLASVNVRISPETFTKPFLFLLLTQGFFAGLVIGKISEGNVKAGLKHSFILVAISWLISTGANLFLR